MIKDDSLNGILVSGQCCNLLVLYLVDFDEAVIRRTCYNARARIESEFVYRVRAKVNFAGHCTISDVPNEHVAISVRRR